MTELAKWFNICNAGHGMAPELLFVFH